MLIDYENWPMENGLLECWEITWWAINEEAGLSSRGLNKKRRLWVFVGAIKLDIVHIQDGDQTHLIVSETPSVGTFQVQIPCYTVKACEAQHNPTWWTIGGNFSNFSKLYRRKETLENFDGNRKLWWRFYKPREQAQDPASTVSQCRTIFRSIASCIHQKKYHANRTLNMKHG